jgi:hypothetical protein
MVEAVEKAIGWLSEAQQAYVQDNIDEIKIIADEGSINPPSNGILTVGNERQNVAIWSALRDWCVANDVTMLFKQFDTSKDTVRLAFARTRGERTI